MLHRSIPPSRRHAVDREHEEETVMDWLRRQQNPVKTPPPQRGITQPQPKKDA